METSYLSKTFNVIWLHGKVWLITSIGIYTLLGFFPIINIWVFQELITSVANLIHLSNNNYDSVLFLLLLKFLIGLLGSIIGHVHRYIDEKIELKLNFELQKKIAQKTAYCPLAYFDVSEFHQHFERIQGNNGLRFINPIRNSMEIGQLTISLVSYVIFLCNVHWGLSVISLLAAVPLLLMQAYFGRQSFKLHLQQTPDIHEANYLANLLTSRESTKEIRIFGLWTYLVDRWTSKNVVLISQLLSLNRKQHYAQIGLDSLSSIFYTIAAIFLVSLIGKGDLEVGQFVAIGQAVQGTQNTVNQFASTLGRVYHEWFYIRDYFRFLEFEIPEVSNNINDRKYAFPVPLEKGIIVKEVSFSYPLSTQQILRNITFTITPGEKIAIVGQNGSGKTTLVKCLMGLYEVSKGKIEFDGVNIMSISKDDLYKHITVIFQDYNKYSLSVRDNIRFGDIEQPSNSERIVLAAKEAGVHEFVKNFPDSCNTYLSRYLKEGEELSGGQWQKIALARAIFRNGEIIILDEPTAAMDPMAEMEVFKLFEQLTEGKTAIFISHRMSAAKMADRIFVMKKGELIEMGTHEELVRQGGEYATMYAMQSQWFQDESNEEHKLALYS